MRSERARSAHWRQRGSRRWGGDSLRLAFPVTRVSMDLHSHWLKPGQSIGDTTDTHMPVSMAKQTVDHAMVSIMIIEAIIDSRV